MDKNKLGFYIVIGFFLAGIIFVFFAAIVHAAPVSTILRNILPETDAIYDFGTSTARWANIWTSFNASGATRCLQITAGGQFQTASAGCGSGGGSSGGTWSTTTSQVSGEFLNYPNNATDVVMIGSVTASSSAKFLFDPNIPFAGFGTTTSDREFAVQGDGLFSGDLGVANLNATGTATFNVTTFNGSANFNSVAIFNSLGATSTLTYCTGKSATNRVAGCNGSSILYGYFYSPNGNGTMNATSSFIGANVYATNTLSVDGTASIANLLSTNSTTTNSTSTQLFATNASTTSFYGAGLNTCTAGNVLTWSGGKFGCAIDATGLLSYDAFTHPNISTSATTSQMLVNSASSTITFLSTSFSTSTQATSTYLVATGIFKATGSASSTIATSLGVGTTTPTNTLDVGGSIGCKMSSTTSSTFNASNECAIMANAVGGNITVNLPSAATSLNRIYIIKKTDGSANTVTVTPASGNKIDFGATAVLTVQDESITIQSDGVSNWSIQ